MSTKEIAAKTRLASKLVSAQLSQLEKNRIIRRIPTSTKNHLYQLEERFFNIWCLMRLGRKNDRQRATWLVKFLEIWCDEQELADRAERHLGALREGKLSPRHALLWSQALAQSLRDPDLQQRVLDTTREYLPQVSESLPESDYSLFAKAEHAYEQGDKKDALKIYQSLTDKEYPEATFNMALLYEEQNKLEQAERYYLSAADKGYSPAMNNLASLYREQGKLEQAERFYLKAVDQGDASAMHNLSLFYWSIAKQPREALNLSRKTAELDPTRLAEMHLGLVALWNEEYPEAFAAIDMELTEFAGEMEEMTIFGPLLIMMLAAKGQSAFALKLFEDERYQHLYLKERLKPHYYAILQEVGEPRRDDALRMGPELEQTVTEIRDYIDVMRHQYRLQVDGNVSEQ